MLVSDTVRLAPETRRSLTIGLCEGLSAAEPWELLQAVLCLPLWTRDNPTGTPDE